MTSNTPDISYTPSSAPGWFLGGDHAWNLARELFVHAERLNLHGTQNQVVGLALLAGAVMGSGLGGTTAIGLALGLTGGLALARGLLQRAMTRTQMGVAIGGVMMQCANPSLALWAEPQARAVLAVQVRLERLASPKGSFDELMNAVAEAALTGQVVRAPLHWWSGRRFQGFLPGPALAGMAPPSSTSPGQHPDRPDR